MRRIISLLAAACLALSLAPAALAQEGEAAPGFSAQPAVTEAEEGEKEKATVGISAALDGKSPNETVDWGSWSINDGGGWRKDFKLVSNKKPVNWSYGEFSDGRPGFPQGFFEGMKLREITQRSDGTYLSYGSVYFSDYTEKDIGTYTGAVHARFEDGTEVEFTVQVIVNAAPTFLLYVLDEAGNKLDANRDNLSRGSYSLKLELVDPRNELQKSGASKLTAKWKIESGHDRIRIGGKVPGNEEILDPQTVQVAGIEEGPLPFALDIEAKNPGKLRVKYWVFADNDSDPLNESYYDMIITGKLDIIDEGTLDSAFSDPSAEEYTLTMDKGDKGLDPASFTTIWDKANGKPVNIEVEGNVTMTFDTSGSLDSGFLNDLKANSGGVFNPSVNPSMPGEASGSGFTGGKWIEFMHSGKLPGKVTIRMPLSGFADGTPLKLWYFDSVTNQATLEPADVSIEEVGGVKYAVFTITHCSAYALYPAGQDPNPVRDMDSSDKETQVSISTTGWKDIREKIQDARKGDTILVTMAKGERLPASVLRALAKMEDVTLKVRYSGETVLIRSGDVDEISQMYYTFSELLDLFGDAGDGGTPEKETAPEDEDAGEAGSKPNPGTGALPIGL